MCHSPALAGLEAPCSLPIMRKVHLCSTLHAGLWCFLHSYVSVYVEGHTMRQHPELCYVSVSSVTLV